MHHRYKKPRNIKLRNDYYMQVYKILGEIVTHGSVHLQNGRLLHFMFVHYIYYRGSEKEYRLEDIRLRLNRKHWAFMVQISSDNTNIDYNDVEFYGIKCFAKENHLDYHHLCEMLMNYQRTIVKYYNIPSVPFNERSVNNDEL